MERQQQIIDGLPVHVFDTRAEMGAAAARGAAHIIREAIDKKGEANVVFAAAPSQDDLIASLLGQDIDWRRVRGFHQDEYIGLDPAHSAGFGNFLRRAIFDRVPFGELFYMACPPDEAEAMCKKYAALLEEYPPDLIFLGVGENGHLAFNDPAVADFNDPRRVKVVSLDDVCRMQQVNDGCFASIDEVPRQALTLTMSQILAIPHAIAVVPTARKARAVADALRGPVCERCPASALRRHTDARLYLDADSASLL